MQPSLATPGHTALSASQYAEKMSTNTEAKIREVTEKLEATFIAEMLKQAKFGETPESFGGGIGEDQFLSYMRQAQADEMAKAGGIGLAETLFQALAAAANREE